MNEISRLIIDWYSVHKRDLPWRNTSNPYFIWLSEVILQQTRVVQGLSYYLRFTERFPTIQDLARASQEEVLAYWQGLGYYSRARNLHAAAQYVADELDGIFPPDYEGLLNMKGIGAYTAAAVASFAYHEDKAVVDGNVIRVISRIFLVEGDVRQPKTVHQIRLHTEALLPAGSSYLFNQGIMELGAMVCLPKNPKCGACPVALFCMAYQAGRATELPVKSKLKDRKTRHLNYLLVECNGELLFIRRGPGDIWEGLFEPVLIESDHNFANVEEFLTGLSGHNIDLPEKMEIVHLWPVEKHVLTHQLLLVSLLHVRVNQFASIGEGRWVKADQVEALPKPVIFSKILNRHLGAQLPLTF